MLTNAALILALVTTFVTSAAATSAAYVAPTFLPSALEWTYEPFSVAAYLEPAALNS